MADERAKKQRDDVAAALAEPALASLVRAGAPVIVAEGDPPRVIDANGAALALLSARDAEELTSLLFDADAPGARRLAELARVIPPGAPARLERVRLDHKALGGAAATLLCRRTAGEPPLFILAGLAMRASHVRPRQGRAPASAQAAEPGAVDASGALEPPSPGLRDLRMRLEARFPGLAPARFLWRTDERNVVVQITPPLAEIVGRGCADLVGRDLIEAATALGLDPRGELAEALGARLTFSRVDVDWPVDQAGAVAPTTLGGLPAFGAEGDFAGWRGFGVIHLDRLRAAPLVSGPFTDDVDGIGGAVEMAAETPPALSDFSGVVVPLRPNGGGRPAPVEAGASAEPPSVARARDAGEDDAALVALAPHERSAFREIARALGGRGTTAGAILSTERHEVAPHGEADGAGDAPNHDQAFVDSFADALPVGVVAANGEELLFANRAALDWLNHPDLAAFAQAGGLRSSFRLAAEDLAPGQKKSLLARVAGGGAFPVDIQCVRAPWRNEDARLYILTRPSVTALEQRIGVLEANLRQREMEADELQSMIDVAADGVVLINADGAILGLDRKAEALLDYDRNQVAGENFTLLLARESQVSALDFFTRAKAGADRQGREALGRSRPGATVPLHLTIGRLGKAVEGKYCLVLRDLSHWKQTERVMEQARERAEHDSQAKSEFLAKVSHEIRTPLNAILGFAEVIMDERLGPVGNDRYKDYLRDIHASGSHVMSLVNDLLDLSKIEAGKMELKLGAVDANRVVSECVSLMQPQANRERVITRRALAANLPPVHADERSLRQIVLNLLANAIRYNEPGGQVIVSTALAESGRAVLRIKDTGVGMSESELRTALEPFRQVAPSPGGTGLGLPLTKALAEANGAGFSIRSRKNEGTLVEVVFALAPGAAESVSAGGGHR